MLGSERVSLKEGEHTYLVQVILDEPELWWPTGLGEQKIYHLRFQLKSGGSKDETTTSFGIREVRLIREPDGDGETFYFEVNGLPVFMKGANYVPQDNFLTRVDTARYMELIASVVEANMNMLRVWGGGFYENDVFYDLCDEYGILVWQDFMFACAMYPGDDAFMENVRMEAVDNVARLSNHPCIALWCGNNEIDEGWHNWGWQKQFDYSDKDSATIWHDYLRVFHDILPGVVEKYDPGTVYWPSSPMTGWGRDEAYLKGDVHYWGVWWGEEPFSRYHEKVGRFVSEYGFQGMPPVETIQSFGGIIRDPASSILHPASSILEAHQKHPRGTELIAKYMARDYHVPDDFEDYVYVSQVMQAEGMGQAFYSHRISQPYCMGTLYWQLNDCWPVTSWSGLDYYGRWKALHYHVKRAYAPLMIRTFQDKNGLHVFALNDHAEGKELIVNCVLASFNGDTLILDSSSISLPPQINQRVYYLEDIPEETSDIVFMAQLVFEDSVVSRTFHYFVPPKSMGLRAPQLNYIIFEDDNGPIIKINSKRLARQVFLEARGSVGRFSDNFFDMAAGETRWIRYTGNLSKDQLMDVIKIKTLYETY
jgi:beta-mannosidase